MADKKNFMKERAIFMNENGCTAVNKCAYTNPTHNKVTHVPCTSSQFIYIVARILFRVW